MQIQERSEIEDSKTYDMLLVQRALAGEQEAFEALVHQYHMMLFHLVYRYMGESDDVYDVLQEVWLRFYLSLSALSARKQILPWLFKVAQNCSLDALRRRRPVLFSEMEARDEEDEVISFLEFIPDTGPTPEELVEHNELKKAVRRAVQALPERYRPIILLYYGSRLNFSQIGHILGRPGSTVKTQFYRAKPFLRNALTEQSHATEARAKTTA